MNESKLNRKIILLRSGLTMAMVARELGVTPQAITNEISGRFKSRRVREGLCRITGATPEEFWPDYTEKKNGHLAS